MDKNINMGNWTIKKSTFINVSIACIQFINYMYSFYGENGIYPMKHKQTNKYVGFSDICNALTGYIKSTNSWGGGDSIDRERLRDILIDEYGFLFPQN